MNLEEFKLILETKSGTKSYLCSNSSFEMYPLLLKSLFPAYLIDKEGYI